jgi:hypothetical protein
VYLALDSGEVFLDRMTIDDEAGKEEQRSRATSMNGQVVGLSYYDSYFGWLCLGLGYVRSSGRDRDFLEIVTPVPPEMVQRLVTAVVAWTGASDIPAQMLYRARPEGDPFCFPSSAFTSAQVASAKSGDVRKNLKRKRLEK